MNDNIISNTEARNKLIAGVRKCAEAVAVTMGTGGSNAIIEAIERPGHLLTNDGYSIINSIQLADPYEDMGRKILLEAINRANNQSGDGSSTTCVLTAAILEEGLKHLTDTSPMELKRSLEECMPLIEASINAQKRDITVDEVGKVASISAEDPKIGAMIQEIYQKIGKDGIIHWDISKTFDDHYLISDGITVDGAGYASPYMADWAVTGEIMQFAKMKAPEVLLVKQKITTASDFNVLFSQMNDKGLKDVVVFCDEFDVAVLPSLLKLRTERGFRTLLVKMPTLWKDWWYADLAKATGATIIDPIGGLSFKDMKLEHLGHVDNITVTKDTTYIEGIKDVTAHVAVLLDEDTDDSKLRASRLNTKTARYFVGAPSDSALSYKRLKVEDAISASYQALQGGVVAGGGVGLMRITFKTLHSTVGGNILAQALYSPFVQIGKNAGIDIPVGTTFKENQGYDTRTGKLVDMFEAGITDPAPVVLNAVRNAVSVAASILTASTVIQLPRPDIADQLIQAILTKGMPQ